MVIGKNVGFHSLFKSKLVCKQNKYGILNLNSYLLLRPLQNGQISCDQ